jgi:tetratricopeptide (TPR) repeat protein
LSALHNQTGRPDKALELLANRRFQPWEGGEGLALGQFVRPQLLLGRAALTRGDAATALHHFESARTPPENLGEARHLLANSSDLHFWLGEAHHLAGHRAAAKHHWKTAAASKGDFQEMSVRAFSELTYFSALALERLGRISKSQTLFRELLAHARQLRDAPARIDYFATSLPTMLLFEDDLQFRQGTTARFLEAQAQLGLRVRAKARRLIQEVLKRDPNHAAAADLLRLLAPPPH